MQKKGKILNDHQKVGQKLIPPFLQDFDLKEISYINVIIPETLWLALLNKKLGIGNAAELSLHIVKVCEQVAPNGPLFSFTSSFEILNDQQKMTIKQILKRDNATAPIQTVLQNFISLYPECPLRFLLDEIKDNDPQILEIKNILTALYDKRSSESTFMLSAVIYHLFCMDHLKVTADTSLSRLPEIENYPNTDISIQIASTIRAAMFPMMQSPFYLKDNNWNKYFWNRGVELEPINL